jgi:hypothetical protein
MIAYDHGEEIVPVLSYLDGLKQKQNKYNLHTHLHIHRSQPVLGLQLLSIHNRFKIENKNMENKKVLVQMKWWLCICSIQS